MTAEAPVTLTLVDARCGHPRCCDQGVYRMRGHCANCGNDKLVGLFTAGHEAGSGYGVCPTCGNRTIRWDGLATPDEIPGGTAARAAAASLAHDEPAYERGQYYQDADGSVFFRLLDGDEWSLMPVAMHYPGDYPRRPLRRLMPEATWLPEPVIKAIADIITEYAERKYAEDATARICELIRSGKA